MRRIGPAVLLACMVVFASASIGYSQSAEDLARGQSAGIRYTKPFTDVCSRSKLVVDIRGNEVTAGSILEWQSDPNCNPGSTIGAFHKASVNKVVNKYTTENKLVLELDGGGVPWGLSKVIVNGHELTRCDKQGTCNGGYIRAQ